MADKSNDPVALWQNMIGEMEKGFNAFANQAMTLPEFSKFINQAGGLAAGSQKQFGDIIEKYLLVMNLPSRAQVVGLAERLLAIEGQLNSMNDLLKQMQKDAPKASASSPTRPPSTAGCGALGVIDRRRRSGSRARPYIPVDHPRCGPLASRGQAVPMTFAWVAGL